MNSIQFSAMPTAEAEALWNGGRDAYDRLPETLVSDGEGFPCRHCLRNIDNGEELFVFAYRPFPELQPYAETGPIFLHKHPCQRYSADEILPPVLTTSRDFIVRGYNENDRIVYGTGAVTAINKIPAYAEELLARPDIAYVHVRSARNNCYQCRIDKVKAPALAEAGAFT
ncbi:DUF1203 domain-containing protein [Rhizobium mesosinicum]|uniref:DUF1203 domain-containing protein n=1 Tax=Rhizobium mesosinicum TaxID=335017 RepID=A0ABS7GVJ2_9HYPH|nr:DUF1203 domain-containing protein [Rhizobium mesosinicum]MBW9053338.1 DUF1203 domain-containing protein [Rhizobium mesosinicum]